jgi:flagellar basal-body rod modification protein FlgD
MEIQNTPQPTAAQPAAGSRAETGSNAMIASDFETFLTMLTVQMQNQDPLNPMESTELASQLAQFSAVEQQVYTNDLLQDLQSNLTTRSMSDLGNWIGMEARAEMPVAFTGEPVTISAPRKMLADRMELVVRDRQGRIVQQMPLPLSDAPLVWNGRDAAGTRLPDGVYDLSVQNWRGEEALSEAPARVYATVEEAQMRDGEVWLTVSGGHQVRAEDVTALRSVGG